MVVMFLTKFSMQTKPVYIGKNAHQNIQSENSENLWGFKVSKDRFTLLLCSNASEDRVFKPLLIKRALMPRAMKGKNLKQLPVHWMANKKP